jgi:hypothetical protein
LAVLGVQDMQLYIYDHGIILSDSASGKTAILSLYSAVLLLNLSLASQHEARLFGQEKAFLRKASLFCSVIVNIRSAFAMPDDMAATLLTLLGSALSNETIMKIMGSVDSLPSILHQESIKGLLLNTMLLNVPTAAQAV